MHTITTVEKSLSTLAITTAEKSLFTLDTESLSSLLFKFALEIINEISVENPMIDCLDFLPSSDPLREECFQTFVEATLADFKWHNLEKERIQEVWQALNEPNDEDEQIKPSRLKISKKAFNIFIKLLAIFTKLAIRGIKKYPLSSSAYAELVAFPSEDIGLTKDRWDHLIVSIKSCYDAMIKEYLQGKGLPENSDSNFAAEEKTLPPSQLPETAPSKLNALLEKQAHHFSALIKQIKGITDAKIDAPEKFKLFRLSAHAIVEANSDYIKRLLGANGIDAKVYLQVLMASLKIRITLMLCQMTPLKLEPRQYSVLLATPIILRASMPTYRELWPETTQEPFLHRAVAREDRVAMEDIITRQKKAVNLADFKLYTPLHIAASSGKPLAVQRLIAEKADINPRNHTGDTPLYLAAYSGHEACVRLLIGAGANIHAVNNKGFTALEIAKERGHKNIVALLESPLLDPKTLSGKLKGFFDENLGFINSAFAPEQDISDVDKIITASKQLFNVDDEGTNTAINQYLQTIPHLNVDLKHHDVAVFKYLLRVTWRLFVYGQKGLAINDKDYQKLTAYVAKLDQASDGENEKNNKRMAWKKLIDEGMAPLLTQITPYLSQQLCYTIKTTWSVTLPKVTALLAAKADPNAKDMSGNAVLKNAVARSHPLEVVTALIEAKADVNTRGRYGFTPLLTATLHAKDPINYVKKLHEAKADLNAAKDPSEKPDDSLSPLHFLLERKHLVSARYLLKHAVKVDETAITIARKNSINLKKLRTQDLEPDNDEVQADSSGLDVPKRSSPSNTK